MHAHLAAALAMTVLAMSAGCGGGAPTSTPQPTGATGYADYAAAACTAWATLFRVVGNPDTAAWSADVRSLQRAAARQDLPGAADLQGRINTELETARRHVAYAGAWPPASRSMTEMDRYLVATEVWITTYVDIAKAVPNTPDPQTAFERAGGVEAWRAMLEAGAEVAPYRPAGAIQCAGAPVIP